MFRKLVLLAGLSAAGVAASQPTYHPNSKDDLLLLYDASDATLPLTAEDIVDAVALGPRSPEIANILSVLGNPIHASFLLSDRRPAEARRGLGVDDLRERLERYVRLSYSDAQEARKAIERFRANPAVLWVGSDQVFEEAATPSDPLFPVPGNGQSAHHQWGIQKPYLNWTSAWDQTFGTAYVAIIDVGIQIDHPDLSKAFRPMFARHIVNDSYTSVDEAYMAPAGSSAGHGTHIAGIVAANSSLSSPPSGYEQPTTQGGAGACWDCSLMIVKLRNIGDPVFASNIAKAIAYSVDIGAQVINLSLAGNETCVSNNFPPICTALDYAAQSEVVVVAAVGNGNANAIGFPAKHPATIAVGGLTPSGVHWRLNDPGGSSGSNIGAGMETRGILAPAQDVVSTVYSGADWNSSLRCGDAFGPPSTPGYGTCTGTSMAAPHIAGIAALMRTVNPMRTAASIRALLLESGSKSNANGGTPDTKEGFGIPNASQAVASSFASNRLTPLFAFKRGADHIYTVVPQIGRAIAQGTLLPRDLNKVFLAGQPLGTTVPGSNGAYAFPGSSTIAKAQVWVFATHINPVDPSKPLAPLRRYVKCAPAPCAWNSGSSDHAYTTQNALSGFDFEGIEGYIYPLNAPQPPGTTVLIKGQKGASGDIAVFPSSQSATMAADGYGKFANLGYVYENFGSRPGY